MQQLLFPSYLKGFQINIMEVLSAIITMLLSIHTFLILSHGIFFFSQSFLLWISLAWSYYIPLSLLSANSILIDSLQSLLDLSSFSLCEMSLILSFLVINLNVHSIKEYLLPPRTSKPMHKEFSNDFNLLFPILMV